MSNNLVGWIKLHREIQNNEFYLSERFTKSQAWIDLLLMTNSFPKTFYIRGNEVKVKAGQVGRSIVTLADRWQWNERTVVSFLKTLESRKMIQYKSNSITTIITIINWKLYQGDTEQNTVQTTEQDTEQMQSRLQTNKKEKKEKKEEKKDISFFEKNSFSHKTSKKEEQKHNLTDTQITDSDSAPKTFAETDFVMVDNFVNEFVNINGCTKEIADKYYSKFYGWKDGKVKLSVDAWKKQFKKWYKG